MAICPLCNEEIDYVCFSEACTEYGTVSWSERYGLEWETNNTEGSGNSTYECPECGGDLNLNNTELLVLFQEGLVNTNKIIHPTIIKKL